MLKKVLVAVVVLVAALVALVATRPARFRVERSVVVEESPRRLYNVVADFRKWEHWSPWAKLDPAMETTFEGTPGRVGSSYRWKGNDKVGEGRLTITGTHPPLQARMRLEFLAPWKSTSEMTFELYGEAAGTRVVWIMAGELDFVGKAMSLFVDMDRAVGPDFEKGLAAIKRGVEDESIPY
jgi:hypothetical protein